MARRALVIGIDKYEQDRAGGNLENLLSAGSDAAKIAELLSSSTNPDNVWEVRTPPVSAEGHAVNRDWASSAIEDLFGRPDGSLLFYFAGHAVPRSDGNTRLEASDGATYSFAELRTAAKNAGDARSKGDESVVVILDCCNSGALAGEVDHANEGLPRNVVILTASEWDEDAHEVIDEASGGGAGALFSTEIVAGLSGEARDTHGEISFAALSDYVARTLPSKTKEHGYPVQRPVSAGSTNLRIVLRTVDPRGHAHVFSSAKKADEPSEAGVPGVRASSSAGRVTVIWESTLKLERERIRSRSVSWAAPGASVLAVRTAANDAVYVALRDGGGISIVRVAQDRTSRTATCELEMQVEEAEFDRGALLGNLRLRSAGATVATLRTDQLQFGQAWRADVGPN